MWKKKKKEFCSIQTIFKGTIRTWDLMGLKINLSHSLPLHWQKTFEVRSYKMAVRPFVNLLERFKICLELELRLLIIQPKAK